MHEKNILILEDDNVFGNLLRSFLEMKGYRSKVFNNGLDANTAIRKDTWELVLIDIVVPEISGLEVLKMMRERGDQTPVIVITGNEDYENEIESFRCKGNIFHRKPVNTRLLLEQINTLLALHISNDHHSLDDSYIEERSKTFVYRGKHIYLSPNEYALVSILLKNKDTVISKERLINELYIGREEVLESSIDTMMTRLRKKLSMNGVDQGFIETIRGFGYRVQSG